MSGILTILSDFPFLKKISVSQEKLIGRDEELQFLKESLYKKRMRNTILVGNSGVGKTAIIKEFASQIKDKYYVLEMNVANSMYQTQFRGQYEEKIGKALDSIVDYNKTHYDKQIIVFVDEIHILNQTGCKDNGCLNAFDILKTYLSKGEITIIGATTKREYDNFIKNDKSISRRVCPIFIDELKEDTIIDILRDFSEGKVDDSILKDIYEHSKEIQNCTNPDTSIEILDRCMAHQKFLHLDEGKISKKTILSVVKMMKE